LLPLAEFAYNNLVHSSIQQTSFFANYGNHPRLDAFDFSKVDNLAVEDLANHLSKVHATMKMQLKEAQERQKNNADAYRKEHP